MTLAIIIGLIVIVAIVGIGLWLRMLKAFIIMLVAVFVVIGIIAFFKYQGYQGFMKMKEGMAHMKQTISTTVATTEDWSQQMEAVGSLRAAKGVDISNELAGNIETIAFRSGGDVKAGTLLVKQRAEDDIAKLHSLEALAKLASITYERDKKQFKVEAVSKATLDNDAANLTSARAQAAEQKALVDKKFIRAPFSGHLGIRNVDVGQYLTPGTAIVTLQQLDPIYLDFTLPQQALAQIKTGQKIQVKNDTWPGKLFDGKIAAINPKVDLATRNVQVRAELANHDHTLLPGMYATAEIAVGEPGRFVTLPQTAITYNPYGNTVYIIENKNKDSKNLEDKDADLVANQAFVTVGETRGDQVQILKGVKEDDVVVSSGQIKLQNGAGVTINNKVTPSSDANPEPEDH